LAGRSASTAGAAGLGFGDRDDDVQHQLHAPEQDRAAVVREAVVAAAPKAFRQQVAEQQLMQPNRIRLIESVHRGSLVSRETASGGRTDRVRETRVYPSCRVAASFNYVVKRTCGETSQMNRTLSAAGRLPRR